MKRIAEQQMRKEDMEEEDSSESTPTMVGQFEVASESVLKGRVIKQPKSRLNRTSNGDPAGISVPPPPPLTSSLPPKTNSFAGFSFGSAANSNTTVVAPKSVDVESAPKTNSFAGFTFGSTSNASVPPPAPSLTFKTTPFGGSSSQTVASSQSPSASGFSFGSSTTPSGSGFIFKPMTFGSAERPLSPSASRASPEKEPIPTMDTEMGLDVEEEALKSYLQDCVGLNQSLYVFLHTHIGKAFDPVTRLVKTKEDKELKHLVADYTSVVQEYQRYMNEIKVKHKLVLSYLQSSSVAPSKKDIKDKMVDVTTSEVKEDMMHKTQTKPKVEEPKPTGFSIGASSFSFGQKTTEDKPATSAPVFGLGSKPTESEQLPKSAPFEGTPPKSKTTFVFGQPGSTPGPKSADPEKPTFSGFSFGAAPAADKPSEPVKPALTDKPADEGRPPSQTQTATPVAFGAFSNEGSKENNSSSSFGTDNKASLSFGNAPAASPGSFSFSFGSNSTATNVAPFSFANTPAPPKPLTATSTGFSFGSAAGQASNSTPGFQFNAAAPVFQPPVTSIFGKSSQEEEESETAAAATADGEEEAGFKNERTQDQIELVKRGAGEEDEETIYEVRCKIYAYNADGSFKDLGINFLKLNRHQEKEKLVRVLARQEGTGTVTLNAKVVPQVEAHVVGAKKKDVNLVLFEVVDGVTKMVRYTVRCKDESMSTGFKQAVEEAVASVQ